MNKKTRLTLIFTGLAILIIGGGLTALLWCVITGFDLIAWFSSKTAMIVYFLLGVYLLFVGYAFIKYKE